MALSEGFVRDHISFWEKELSQSYYSYRKFWPSCLFHHAPLENAVAILKDGYLKSRNETNASRPCDVAAPSVIDARIAAHDRVRLYFRPKTPTQWHIEGIRKANECQYGETVHAPILVMFVLNAEKILTLSDTYFSDKNMQSSSAEVGNDETFFRQIPFLKVFSEGGIGGDTSIIKARCAEVLPCSPLPLANYIKGIFFRSEPERDTLLHMLGDKKNNWASICKISDELKIFQKEYTFLQKINLTPKGVVFKLNDRKDQKTISIKITVSDPHGNIIFSAKQEDFKTSPDGPNIDWIYKKEFAPGIYKLEVIIEDKLAYKNDVLLGDSIF